jgi:putative SOS response-associated peptidase YedK
MCGRYRLSRRKQLIEEYFDTVSDEPEWEPRYNIAPTQPVPVIRQNSTQPRRELCLMLWGLIPSWAKSLSGPPMINARSETVATTLAFRDPIKSHRCLIPADGFYEWQKSTWPKQPFCFEVNDGELFAFARFVGSLERPKRAMDQVVLNPDHDTEHDYVARPRPNARHSRPRQLAINGSIRE